MSQQRNQRRVLLLGEGDFSFAVALAKEDVELVATGLDTEEEVQRKYSDAGPNLRKLARLRRVASVHHGVDATRLTEWARLGLFDDVVFTHPHLGTEDCVSHYALLAHFFAVCRLRLREDTGAIHITLASEQAVTWRAKDAAARHGWRCVAHTPFVDSAFPGYTRRRSLSGSSFRNRSAVASTTLSFTATGVPATPPWHTVSPNPKTCNCDVCGRRFVDDTALAKHVAATHTEAPCVPVDCQVCGQPYADAISLRLHMVMKHESELSLTLKPDWFLLQHAPSPPDSSSTYSVGPLECTICGLTYPNQQALDLHARLVPREPPLLTCLLCSRSFRELRALHQHKLAVHLSYPVDPNTDSDTAVATASLSGPVKRSPGGVSSERANRHVTVGSVHDRQVKSPDG